MLPSCREQSELRRLFEIGAGSPPCRPLSPPLSHVCRPAHKGHEDLTSSPPSSGLSPAVSAECPASPAGNCGWGLRSLRDLTQHLTTRADDSHAAPVSPPARTVERMPPPPTGPGQGRLGFSRCVEIHPLPPPLCRPPSIPL